MKEKTPLTAPREKTKKLEVGFVKHTLKTEKVSAGSWSSNISRSSCAFTWLRTTPFDSLPPRAWVRYLDKRSELLKEKQNRNEAYSGWLVGNALACRDHIQFREIQFVNLVTGAQNESIRTKTVAHLAQPNQNTNGSKREERERERERETEREAPVEGDTHSYHFPEGTTLHTMSANAVSVKKCSNALEIARGQRRLTKPENECARAQLARASKRGGWRACVTKNPFQRCSSRCCVGITFQPEDEPPPRAHTRGFKMATYLPWCRCHSVLMHWGRYAFAFCKTNVNLTAIVSWNGC